MSGQERRSWPGRPGVRRRQTLPSFPATPPTEEDRTLQPQQSQESLKKHSRSSAVTSSSSTSSEPRDSGPTRGRRVLHARLSGDGQTTTHVARVATSFSGFSDVRGPNKRRLGRTPSSPSVLLSKVKERIREKVSKTQCDKKRLACNRKHDE